MASYRERLTQDLDRWISVGLVASDSRAAILETLGAERRLDAATVLGILGGLLAGVAAIAFVAANWSEIPRLLRFAMILTLFLSAACGAAWASGRGRPIASQVLLSVAALVFAAAIGLTGQIFDIAGEPLAALRGAGVAAILLGLAGRSPWTLAVGLVFLGLGDLAQPHRFDGASADLNWLIVAAPLGALTALVWRSQALAHVAGLACLVAVVTLGDSLRQNAGDVFLVAAVVLGVAAAGARAVRFRFEGPASVLNGWFVAGALLWFGISGVSDEPNRVIHGLVWMLLSIGVIVVGRQDRHAMVTATGVLGLLASGAFLLFSLGVGLMTSAAVFGTVATGVLILAFLIRRGPAK